MLNVNGEENQPPVEAGVEEVRVAMALNGGVSLAVWMGGCAVELDAARRAHLGPEPLAYGRETPSGGGAGTVRRVYNALCQAFDRRLSIDIMTGSSAGGINGALLSAAMVSGRRLHPRFVRERWLELGDLLRLLHDPGEREPKALMDGDYFHEELLRAFRLVSGEGEGAGAGDAMRPGRGAGDPLPPGRAGDEEMLAAGALPPSQRRAGEARLIPDLDVTMTDVVGAELTFTDEWGLPLVAREHAPRFRFRDEADFGAAKLAAAARASASFPLAFEPLKIPTEAAPLAGLTGTVYAIDGGVLDNAPIRAALDLIPFRPAGARVRRYACYMNADPTQPEPGGGDGPQEPTVQDVLGYVIGLPRTAPFAEQLKAVREATLRPGVTTAVVQRLLRMDLTALEQTANALLPAYRRRRAGQSVDELAGDPAQADAARAGAGVDQAGVEGKGLPWIPDADAIQPPQPGSWEWGIRPAERILHLLLDLVRESLHSPGGAPAEESLLALRSDLDGRLAQLEQLRARASTGVDVATLAIDGTRATVYGLLAGAAANLQGLAGSESDLAEGESPVLEPWVSAALFGPPPEPTAAADALPPLDHFFRRVLAIEVVRRALGDEAEIETGQGLSFVQLTPAAPTPLLSRRPLTEQPPPAEAKDKLTGLGLAHFAGFYRRAWRANDFMWGRLDAAARVVDLLLDRPPQWSGGEGTRLAWAQERAKIIAEAVLSEEATVEERWLVQEVLADPVAIVPESRGEPLDADSLRELLTLAITRELYVLARSPLGAEQLPLTRAVCARAAQLEAIRDELPVLVEEAAADGELGSSGQPLELGGEGAGLREQIEALRTTSLPQRLTGRGEAVSQLGLGTISRAVRVGISMAESTAMPLARFLGILRVPALAVSGVVAREPLHRATALAAFTAAAIYLTSRAVTAQPEPALFSDAWSLPVLLALVAVLVVIPAIAVPLLQAGHGIEGRLNAARAVALALSGGIAAALLALCAADPSLNLEQVLLAPGADAPCTAILAIALAATAGLALLRLPFFSDGATRWLRRPRSGKPLCLLMIAVSALVGVAAAIPLFGQIDEGWWRTVSVLLAFPGAPLAAAWLLFGPDERRRTTV